VLPVKPCMGEECNRTVEQQIRYGDYY